MFVLLLALVVFVFFIYINTCTVIAHIFYTIKERYLTFGGKLYPILSFVCFVLLLLCFTPTMAAKMDKSKAR